MIYEAAQRVSDRHGLPSDWLNDGVKGFLPGKDLAATVLFDRPGLAVRVASPRYLFAMKVLAARVERDADDIQRAAEFHPLWHVHFSCRHRDSGEAQSGTQKQLRDGIWPEAELSTGAAP